MREANLLNLGIKFYYFSAWGVQQNEFPDADDVDSDPVCIPQNSLTLK
jgi:hypothetical protein